jgi:hypothetical protein
MGFDRVPKQDQIEAVIRVPEDPLHAFLHRRPPE